MTKLTATRPVFVAPQSTSNPLLTLALLQSVEQWQLLACALKGLLVGFLKESPFPSAPALQFISSCISSPYLAHLIWFESLSKFKHLFQAVIALGLAGQPHYTLKKYTRQEPPTALRHQRSPALSGNADSSYAYNCNARTNTDYSIDSIIAELRSHSAPRPSWRTGPS